MSRYRITLDGKTYDLDVTGVGVFPLMMQVIHNNFTDGIHKIGKELMAVVP